ncbi:MAG: hypothetical protein OSA99_20720, partial [Acidimicrobiales bacterium]|nr:hypothetical protein [Acidimicrobiales bacterium]
GALVLERFRSDAKAEGEEGEDSCEGIDGDPIVQVAFWESAQAGIDGEDPVIVTEGFDDLRFAVDGQAFTIAFAPEGAEIPIPPSTTRLSSVGSDLGVPEDEVPDDAEFDPATGETVPGDEPSTDESTDDTTVDSTDDTTVDSTDDTTDDPVVDEDGDS